jgi:hypothetical protein
MAEAYLKNTPIMVLEMTEQEARFVYLLLRGLTQEEEADIITEHDFHFAAKYRSGDYLGQDIYGALKVALEGE